MFLIFKPFIPLYVLTNEVAVIKSHNGTLVKHSRYLGNVTKTKHKTTTHIPNYKMLAKTGPMKLIHSIY